MRDTEMNSDVTARAHGASDAVKAPAGVTWIWFDLDDTLYDFAASSLIALRGVYDKYRLDRFFSSVEQWTEVYHRHNSALWKLYNAAMITQQQLRFDRFYLPLLEGGVPEEENRRLNPQLDVDYLAMLGSTGLLVDGAAAALSHLRERGFHIGILSNGFRGVQHEKLRSSGIGHLIDKIVLSDDINVNKPDRRIYEYALEQAGATAAGSLMIGDNPDTDIAGAVRAGWHALLYAPHAPDEKIVIERREIGVIRHLDTLLNW